MDIAKEFLNMLTDAADDTLSDLAESKEHIALYSAERALHLSTIAHEPGFGQAVTAERNSVAMRAGIKISDDASAVDQRWVGMIGGALRIGALAIAPALEQPPTEPPSVA